jgi:hypothetical protein
VEDLPGVDLVGPELVGSLHWSIPRGGSGDEDDEDEDERAHGRVRQAANQARRRREWEWEQDGTPAQHLLLDPKPEGLSWGWARILEAHFELTENFPSIFFVFTLFYNITIQFPECYTITPDY